MYEDTDKFSNFSVFFNIYELEEIMKANVFLMLERYLNIISRTSYLHISVLYI